MKIIKCPKCGKPMKALAFIGNIEPRYGCRPCSVIIELKEMKKP